MPSRAVSRGSRNRTDIVPAPKAGAIPLGDTPVCRLFSLRTCLPNNSYEPPFDIETPISESLHPNDALPPQSVGLTVLPRCATPFYLSGRVRSLRVPRSLRWQDHACTGLHLHRTPFCPVGGTCAYRITDSYRILVLPTDRVAIRIEVGKRQVELLCLRSNSADRVRITRNHDSRGCCGQ